ncbi:MAG TPA: calcium-binding protein [Solirubrobacterales bacterium]|nr:calcium-binding protein [Solirubrobacterales bacterium]
MLATLGTVASGGAATPPACGAPRISADNTKAIGTPCADVLVVTSPEVEEVVGGEGDDVIFANPNVEVVDGGAGDDVISGDLPEPGAMTTSFATGPVYMPAPEARRSGATASIVEKKCEANKSCYGGDGSQELIGSTGNDKIFGQRGNDILLGNSGNDQLFGGVGDESSISGGSGNDLLSGGLGTDNLNGNQESDLVRGDGTIDYIEDSGPSGTDTLSFATAVTPGFHGGAPSGFPADSNGEERGVALRMDGWPVCEGPKGEALEACNNDARYGGGSDDVVTSGFENVIGSPFADFIVGSTGANRIDGGGGADAIYGHEGDDVLYGGADGDYLKGDGGNDTIFGQGGTNHCEAETANECSGSTESVIQRDRSKISVGFMATNTPATLSWMELYVTGSTGVDRVKASYTAEAVTFTTEAESAAFDTSADAASPGCSYEAGKVKCTLPKPLDAITMAGMGGNDRLTLEGFQELTTPVLLGGEGGDELISGSGTEDLLVDGNGNGDDTLSAANYDDALINNEGKDKLEGGQGNDLLLSATNCEGDTLDGAKSSEGDGADVNSTSWAKLPVNEGAQGVLANLEAGSAGNAAGPSCTSGETGKLLRVDDLEGSSGIDKLVGDGNDNNLLGRLSSDELLGQAGKDNIESAEDGVKDTVAGGAPTTSPGDTCRYDKAFDSIGGCETKNGV